MFTGKQIRDKRESLKLSAAKLAKLLNTTKENVYKWEGGTVPRTLEHETNIENWLKNGTVPKRRKKIESLNVKQVSVKQITPSSNGVDWQKKYYDLLEKYTALLEKMK